MVSGSIAMVGRFRSLKGLLICSTLSKWGLVGSVAASSGSVARKGITRTGDRDGGDTGGGDGTGDGEFFSTGGDGGEGTGGGDWVDTGDGDLITTGGGGCAGTGEGEFLSTGGEVEGLWCLDLPNFHFFLDLGF